MEIPNDIAGLKSLVAQLLARISQLETENAELRRRLGLKSHNSDKPPSSDGLSKKSVLPKESGKKNGGQVGHAGKTLRVVANPDEVVVHHAARCLRCQREFSESEAKIISKRQVFDLPQPRLDVVEHQLGEIECCGEKYYGEFPEGVRQAVQYGERIKAMSVLLNNEYRLPLEKISRLFSDLYNSDFNQQTILAAGGECFEKLASVAQEIREELIKSEVVNFDETGLRVEGQLNWLHVAATKYWTSLFVHHKRGHEAMMSEDSILPKFEHSAVHDCWESYFKFEKCHHILCNAHLLRELEGLKEQGSMWGQQMQELIFEMYEASAKGTQVLANRGEWESKYEKICELGDEEEPPPTKGKRGKPKNSVGRNLLNRLKKHQAGVLEYAFREEVPFTNNQAERDIRPAKIKQKISNSFRTEAGAKNYARIQGFVSTLRKQGMNVFQEIVNVFKNKTIIFQTAR